MRSLLKCVRPNEMARIEKMAYSEGSSEEAFMESAGSGCADLVMRAVAKYHLKPKIALLCGKGNNGGDAYVAGRILLAGGFDVHALAIVPLEESSPLCQTQSKRFQMAGGKIDFIKNREEISFGDAALLVDGLYGTGFQGTVSGLFSDLIQKANNSNLPIISIDIPSGINGEGGKAPEVAIVATETLFLGLPKSGCFLRDAWKYVGKVSVHDFGLPQNCIEDAHEDFILLQEEEIRAKLPRINRVRHKYEAGYVVGLGGSFGMPGAAILSGFAALRSGAGIVRILHPFGMEHEFSGAPPELIREGYKDLSSILKAMDRASALFIGPGIGTSNSCAKILKKLLQTTVKPCVIDAEALTLIAKDRLPMPVGAILTPHAGEMKRLLGLFEEISPWDYIRKVQDFAEKNKVTVVLKGAPTFIFHPHKKPCISTRGDPGMATAGSGDVLTGMIAALLAQRMQPCDAAKVGVFLHGLAGEKAASKKSSYSMVASDITEELPEIFRALQTPW